MKNCIFTQSLLISVSIVSVLPCKPKPNIPSSNYPKLEYTDCQQVTEENANRICIKVDFLDGGEPDYAIMEAKGHISDQIYTGFLLNELTHVWVTVVIFTNSIVEDKMLRINIKMLYLDTEYNIVKK